MTQVRNKLIPGRSMRLRDRKTGKVLPGPIHLADGARASDYDEVAEGTAVEDAAELADAGKAGGKEKPSIEG